MCVIIKASPGTRIPKDMLEIACVINTDGFGVSTVMGDGVLETVRFAEKDKDNDVEQVDHEAHKHIDKLRFIHLRHATVGEVSLANAHPFRILNKNNKKLIDLEFMHNGTLYEWKPDQPEFSDSSCFAQHVVTPLALRTASFVNKNGSVVDDLFFRRMMVKFCTVTSVFVFYDGFGNHFIVNEKLGKQFDGWWASNEYSFDKTQHRYKSSKFFREDTTWSQGPPGTNHGKKGSTQHGSRAVVPYGPSSQVSGKEDWPSNLIRLSNDSHTYFKSFTELGQIHPLEEEIAAVSRVVKYYISTNPSKGAIKNMVEAALMVDLSKRRDAFTKLTGLGSISELRHLTLSNFAELCSSHPKVMAMVFTQVLTEVAARGQEIEKLKTANKA